MLVMIGASASGKTEIAKILIKDYNFSKMVTYTTRSIRKDEVNGVDYHFVNMSEFLKKKKSNDFLETSLYNTNFYGTAFKDTELYKVLIVDPDGANSIYRKKMKDVVFCYLITDENVREKRMTLRGDDFNDILRRLELDRKYFTLENLNYIDFEINTSTLSLEFLTNKIYNLYIKTIK
ncbi:MAG: hypothetical protein QM489_04155 [Candidatus Izemoplasma sp.]